MQNIYRLMSFIYNPVTDKYEPIKVWEDPNDSGNFVAMATIASRERREKLFKQMVIDEEIIVGANGRCERDAGRLVSQMYGNFSNAMRTDFSPKRPAQPLLFVDGTGGSLGKGVCHSEIGSADFCGDCKHRAA